MLSMRSLLKMLPAKYSAHFCKSAAKMVLFLDCLRLPESILKMGIEKPLIFLGKMGKYRCIKLTSKLCLFLVI